MIRLLAPLAWLGRYATQALALGVFIGILLPDLARLVRPGLDGMIFAITIVTMLRVDWPALYAYLRRPRILLLLLLWVLVGSPLLMSGVVALLPLPAGLSLAMVLMAAAPPIASSAVFAALLGLDAALALMASVLATLLVPFTLPVIALHLTGVAVEIDAWALFVRLILLIGGAVIVVWLLRWLVGVARIERNLPIIGGLTVLILVAFAIAIMDGVARTALDRPGWVLLYALAGFGGNLLLNGVGTMLFWRLGWRRALTVGLISGNCNMGLVWAGLGASAAFDVTLFFAIAQLPIYILPSLVRLLANRLAARQPVS